jgi:DnaJ-class molecular chaperone
MTAEHIIFRGVGRVREDGNHGDLQIKVEIAKTEDFEIIQGHNLLSLVKIPYKMSRVVK